MEICRFLYKSLVNQQKYEGRPKHSPQQLFKPITIEYEGKKAAASINNHPMTDSLQIKMIGLNYWGIITRLYLQSLGSMSQPEHPCDRLPPSPPRSKPLKFHLSQQLPLYLDNPQHNTTPKTHPPLAQNKTRSKSSILSFLALRKYPFQQSSF